MELNPAQRELRRIINLNHKITVAYGGAGSGKTAGFLYNIIWSQIEKGTNTLILRNTRETAKLSIWKQMLPEVLEKMGIDADSRNGLFYKNKSDLNLICRKHQHPYLKDVIVPESMIEIGGMEGDKIQKYKGSQWGIIYINEADKVPDPEAIEELMTRLRGSDPNQFRRIFIDLNPDLVSHWTTTLITENTLNESYVDVTSLHMNPLQNIKNVGEDYIKILSNLSPALYKKYYSGEFRTLDDSLFPESRMRFGKMPDFFDVIVIGIDPAVTVNEKSDLTGIIITAKLNNHYYILDDLSGKYSPERWRDIVTHEYIQYEKICNRIVVSAEVNQGGDLLRFLIKESQKLNKININYQEYRAIEGKIHRAERLSIAMTDFNWLFNQDRFESLKMLCSQLINYCAESAKKSPDRVDAFIVAGAILTEGRKLSFKTF